MMRIVHGNLLLMLCDELNSPCRKLHKTPSTWLFYIIFIMISSSNNIARMYNLVRRSPYLPSFLRGPVRKSELMHNIITPLFVLKGEAVITETVYTEVNP